MTTQIKINSTMAKYRDVKLRKVGHSNSVTIPKNPYTDHVKRYTPYISSNGTVVLKPNHKFNHSNPWKSKFYRNYDFNQDMKQDPNTRPLHTKLGAEYKR